MRGAHYPTAVFDSGLKSGRSTTGSAMSRSYSIATQRKQRTRWMQGGLFGSRPCPVEYVSIKICLSHGGLRRASSREP
jgi:hypothetical protein